MENLIQDDNIQSDLHNLTQDGMDSVVETFIMGKYAKQIQQVIDNLYLFVNAPDAKYSNDLRLSCEYLATYPEYDLEQLVVKIIASTAVSRYSEIVTLVARNRKSLYMFDDLHEQASLMGNMICSMHVKGFIEVYKGNKVEGSAKPCLINRIKLPKEIKTALACWESKPFHLTPVKVKPKLNRHTMSGNAYNINENAKPDYDSLQAANDVGVRITPNLEYIQNFHDLVPSEKQSKNMKNFEAWESSVNTMSNLSQEAGIFYFSHRFQPTGREQCNSTVVSYQGNKQTKWRIHSAEPYVMTDDGLFHLKAYIGELSGIAKNATREFYVAWVDEHLETENYLEYFLHDARYLDAVLELRKVLNGESTTIYVPQDAPASGSSLISLLMGCEASLTTCGMFGMDVRSEPYTNLANAVKHILGSEATRDFAKSLIVPRVFGCRGGMKQFTPELRESCTDYFDAEFPALTKYLELCSKLCPTGSEGVTVENWRGFQSYIPFTLKRQERISLEVIGSVMTFKWKENGRANKGNTFLAPALAHIIDATLIAETKARLNYDLEAIQDALAYLNFQDCVEGQLTRPIHMGECVKVIDGVVDYTAAEYFEVRRILQMCLEAEPVAILCEFDDLLAPANHARQVRLVYTDIMASLVDCNVLQEMLISATGKKVADPRSQKSLGAELKKYSQYCLA